jgi:serine protease Do
VRDVADPNGPAAKAGIQTNDIITEFGGRQVSDAQDLINRVAATEVGKPVEVAYLRETGGRLERRTASVTVGERPANRTLQGESGEPSVDKKKTSDAPNERPTLGLKVSELTAQLAAEKNLKNLRGVYVADVEPGSLADDARLDEGMVIMRVNRVPVDTLADFQSIIAALKPGDPVVMHVADYQNDRVLRRVVQFTFQ